MKTVKNLKYAILLFLLLGLNVLASSAPFQLDLTANRFYSLSPVTKDILSRLDDIVTIKFFLSAKLPPQFLTPRQRLLTFLNRYRQLNPKIQIKILDPTKDSQARQIADHLGITPLQFSAINQNQLQVTQGYFALSASYRDREQVIPLEQLLNNPEYSLTATIAKLTQKNKNTLGWVTDGQTAQPLNLSIAWKSLQQFATPQLVSLNQPPLADIKTLLIINPQADFSAESQKNLTAFFQSGGGVLILFDKYQINNQLYPQLNKTNLTDWLKKQGFDFQEKKFVASRHAALANFQNSQGQSLLTLYSFWPIIDRGNINHRYAPLAGSQKTTFFWATPITLNQGADWLVRSDKQAWLASPNNLLPTSVPQTDQLGQFVLGGYRDQPGRLAVIADSDFIKNQNLYHHPENLAFFLDLVDLVSNNPQLAKLRNKLLLSRPLPPLTSANYYLLAALSLALPSLVIILTGLLVWWHYRRGQKN